MNSYLINFLSRMFKSPGMIYVIIINPLFLSIFPGLYEPTPAGVLFPSSILVGAFFATAIFVAIAMSWGYVYTSIKNSSIKTRMITNGYSEREILLYSLIPLLIVVMFTTLYTFMFIGIFYAGGIIPKDGGLLFGSVILEEFSSSLVNWGVVILSWLLSVLLSFSITIFAVTVIKSEMKYSTIMWIYILLLFFFGGTSTPPNIIRGDDAQTPLTVISYIIPNTFTNFLMGDALATGNGISFDWSSTDSILNITIPIVLSGGLLVGSYSHEKMKN